VDVLGQRLARVLRQDARRRRVEIEALARRLSPEGLRGNVRQRRHAMDQRERMLASAMRARVASRRDRVDALSRALQALSPLGVLERGYAVLQDDGGRVVRASGEVVIGQGLRARLARGRLDVTVTGRGEG
jgi:exodeoxyribonuclease VII large subunit